jgi:hypothetical protein
VLLLVFGFLPIVNWIPGGHEAPWYRARLDEWVTGSAIVVGAGVVLSILARRIPFPDRAWTERLLTWISAHQSLAGWLVATIAFIAYCAVALGLFSGVPLHLDELTQVIQAQIFAQGRLFVDAPAHPEFTSLLHVLDTGGKWYTQFPPGGPAMLLPAVWAGTSWIAGPLCGALGVRVFWSIAHRTESKPSVASGATLLFAFAPFVLFMSGSHMNHVSTLLFALLATLASLRAVAERQRQRRLAFLAGLALGAMGMIRPVDAVAFALPIGAWLAWRSMKERTTRDPALLMAAGVGVALPLILLALYNLKTTGSAFAFAYEVQWGRSHGLGFHRAPWGFSHTPGRGLELVSLYFLRLQSYLFEAPIPSLIFPAVALFLTKKLALIDRLWLTSGALLILLYFLYWHDGFYLGPRFFYLLVPMLALWSARLPALLATALEARPAVWDVVRKTLVATLLFALSVNLPLRARQYRAGLPQMRTEAAAFAAASGAKNSLILVRETWGAQLMARLWAVDVSRSEAETIYRSVDACEIEEGLHRFEKDPSLSHPLEAFRSRLADSAKLIPSTLSPDVTERMLPGRPYSDRCIRRVNEDRAGFTLLAPLLVQDWRGNVFARDLHERDSLLLRDYPTRQVYLLRSAGSDPGAQLELIPLSRDSVLASWRSTSNE